ELDARVNENPSNENLTALREAVMLSDKIGGGEWGASGRARQIRFVKDDSLGSFFLEKMEANKTDVLTEKQKDEVRKQHDDYVAAEAKWEAEKKRLEDKVARLEAAKEIKETVK